MNFYAVTVLRRYEEAGALKSEPPQDAPTDFWLDVLYYQKMFDTEWKTGMKGFGPQNFSHLSVHAEMKVEEMVLKWIDEWMFWMFDEIGSFTLQEDELEPQDGHEYVVQKASHPHFSTFEIYDMTDDCVVWGADTTEECDEWIKQDKCIECGEWSTDFFIVPDGVVCADCQGDE